MSIALFLSVFLIAACGLIYELIAGTLASYLLGDTVFQFSTIIGCYLFAMGIGSYLSRFLHRGLVARFVSIELMVGVVGGFSSSILFLAFAYTEAFRFILYAVVILVGTLVGLEIPLLMRILKERFQFRELVSHVLTFDYLGALGASLLFPILLVPKLGLVRSALVFGIFNVAVALWSTYLFREQIGRSQVLRAGAIGCLGAPWNRHDLCQSDLFRGRQQSLCRRGDLQPQYSVSAHRAHEVEGRSAPVPEFASAVQLAR